MQQVEDDDAFCRLIYRFTVNKMILKYRTRAKTRTNERHDETSRKGRNCDTANLNQMIFYVRSMSTQMGGSGPIGFPDSAGLAEGHPGLRRAKSWELGEGRLIRVDMPKISHADGRVFWPWLGEGLTGCRLATDKCAGQWYRLLFVSRLQRGAEG